MLQVQLVFCILSLCVRLDREFISRLFVVKVIITLNNTYLLNFRLKLRDKCFLDGINVYYYYYYYFDSGLYSDSFCNVINFIQHEQKSEIMPTEGFPVDSQIT